jgi:beta-lactamase regulating signal transducer with metallopeptidase domain
MSDFVYQILNHDWFTFAVECVVMASACAACLAAVVLAVRLTTGRWLAPRYRHALWLVVALRLFVPVAPESRFSLHRHWLDALTAYTDSASVSEESADQELAPVPAPTFDLSAEASQPVIPAGFVPGAPVPIEDFWSPKAPDLVNSAAAVVGNHAIVLLVLAWPVGMILTAGWIGLATWDCRRQMRAFKGTCDGRLLAVLDSCQKALRVRRRVELVLVSGLGSPAQVGLFRPRILLPEDVARDFSEDELRHILLHELAHVKRWDVAINMLLSLLQVVYWWNPVFWFVRSRLKTERELACDALVVGVIGAARSTSYGHTLIRIVERLSEAVADSWSPPAAAPGLISFLGRAAALKARLRHLPRSTAGNSRKAQIAAWLVMGVLVVTGLTDAKSDTNGAVPVIETSFKLPQSVTWSVAPTIDQPRVTVVYDCGAVLDRFVREEHVTREVARLEIISILKPSNAGPLSQYSSADGDAPTTEGADREQTGMPRADKPTVTTGGTRELSCEWQEDRLVCRGPQPVLASISNALKAWQEHGLLQISCSVQQIESSIDVLNKLGIQGGQVVSPTDGDELELPESAGDAAFRPQRGAAVQVRSATLTERRTPVYLKVLDPASVQRLRTFVQGDARASLLMSPKVTVFQGQPASIYDLVHRPYVVGLHSTGEEAPAARLKTVAEGLQYRLLAFANAETDRVRLQIGIVDSHVTDMTFTTVVGGPDDRPLTVQVPSFERRAYSVSAELSTSESLLLHPLEETAGHRRRYIVVTAMILTLGE